MARCLFRKGKPLRYIDFHTHIFPDKLAEKAIDVLSMGGGGFRGYTDGTLNGLINSMNEAGIEKSAVLNIATNPKQQRAVNDFAAEINGDRVVSFGSVHPDAPDALDEIDRICDLGLMGVKFHLECQDFEYDHPALKKIYEKIAKKGLIVCFHCGWDMSTSYCRMTPDNLIKTLPMLEGATVIAAHLGAYAMWPEVLDKLCGKDVYFDTAFSCGRIPLKLGTEIVKRHGVDRILLGSDLPWASQKDEIRFVSLMDLTDDEKEKIYHGNADRLIKEHSV